MKILQHNVLRAILSYKVRDLCYRNCKDLIASEILDYATFTSCWNPVERIVTSGLREIIKSDLINEK